MKQLFALVLVTLIGLIFGFSSPAVASEIHNEVQIFEIHCAGCHINGGNIVRRNKTLKLKALQKNNMDSVEAIAEIVTNGKGNMSAYKDRLTQEEIQAVAAYVLNQAEIGWPR